MSRSFPRTRSTAAIAYALTALALSACSDTPTAPSSSVRPLVGNDAQYSELNNQSDSVHVMAINSGLATTVSPFAGGAGSGAPILYHGGPVMQAGTRVASVYWAAAPIFVNGPAVGTSGPGSADASLVGYFLNHLGGSRYFNINSSYTGHTGVPIVNSVAYTQYWANGTLAPSGTQVVSNAAMLAMLQRGFSSGALTYDGSTLYAIFTSGKVNLGGGFGTQYCAYHTHGSVTLNGVARQVFLAAMPYNYAYPSACTSRFAAANGSADPGADYEVNTLAHETEETTTDALGNAWFDMFGYENADKCAWTWGTTYTTAAGGIANMIIGGKNFLVQRNWLRSGGCALSY
jgi:hypothetical protein